MHDEGLDLSALDVDGRREARVVGEDDVLPDLDRLADLRAYAEDESEGGGSVGDSVGDDEEGRLGSWLRDSRNEDLSSVGLEHCSSGASKMVKELSAMS